MDFRWSSITAPPCVRRNTSRERPPTPESPVSPTMPELVAALARPRQIILMVKAGVPVDAVLTELAPLLDPGDIVVDGGNSFFRDTERREAALAAQNLMFVGMGVSGGELGALWGPSLMPGGPREAYDVLEPMLSAIAAKSAYGPCVSYIGPGGSGHYVKMVHNGIEYGDMQLIAESYDVMRSALGMPAEEIATSSRTGTRASSLDTSSRSPLTFFAISTRRPDSPWSTSFSTRPNKRAPGAGRSRALWSWRVRYRPSMPRLRRAISPRCGVCAFRPARSWPVLHRREGRSRLAALLGGADGPDRALAALEDALYFSKVSSYSQGMALLNAASAAYPGISTSRRSPASGPEAALSAPRSWPTSCAPTATTPSLANLLLDPQIAQQSDETVGGVRRAIIAAGPGASRCPGRRRRSITSIPCASHCSRQSHPGATRLFRRAHVPTQRSGRRLPHAVARR